VVVVTVVVETVAVVEATVVETETPMVEEIEEDTSYILLYKFNHAICVVFFC
jgi:hypothetical protein